MSDNCCHCCERRELKKQCQIDTWGSEAGRTVHLHHIPTGVVIVGIDEDDVLDALDLHLARKLEACVN